MTEKSSITDLFFPHIIEFDDIPSSTFVDYYFANKATIESLLQQRGAVKFRGIQIDEASDFQRITDSISSKFLNYIDGNSPRTKLTGHVYTSTEYDKSQRITMHNELSYSAKWPNKLFFSCLTPAETGGETLLADSREIYQSMDDSIIGKIVEKGILYIRNLHGGKGIGPTWQETFETDNKSQASDICCAYNMDFEWLIDGSLRVKQYHQGIIEHRVTREKVWFNQIDQFHPSQLGPEMYETLQMIYDSPEKFPMYVTFGDGREISQSMVEDISHTIQHVTVAPPWKRNELLIIDNELVAHGRNPFTGARKVVVAMSE